MAPATQEDLEMFDKLIVSEPDREAVKNRRNYFLVSSVVVGVLFITGVVISIFAADYGLGPGSFELTELVAPMDLEAAAPQPVRPQTARTNSSTEQIIRRDNIQNIVETPHAPTAISTTPNASMARPIDLRFTGGPVDSGSVIPNGTGRDTSDPGGPSGPGGLSQPQTVADIDGETTPPPVIKKAPTTVSKGVINGIATNLPKPAYPEAARLVDAKGAVNVQVLIDEQGNVISAHAAGGHPLLRVAAESAAKRAKFSPTFLSEVPVKVTGVIVYNFIR